MSKGVGVEGQLVLRTRPLPSAALDVLHHQHAEGSCLVLEMRGGEGSSKSCSMVYVQCI